MVIFNWVGLGMVLLGAFAAVGLEEIVGGRIGELTGGIVMIAVDLVYRSKRKHIFPVQNFNSKAGGHIMFIPVWIIGAIIFVFGLA